MKTAARAAMLAAMLAALLGATASTDAVAQELGRLFFTPEQRTALDARRKARVPDKPAATPQVESPITRVNGEVQRSGGKSTVWVNGEAIPESASPAGQAAPRAVGPGRVSIPAGEGSKGLDMRVGESLNRGTGEVRDLIGDGEIKVGPPRNAPGK
ncbi:MAG TPA: hypothetical protein VMJ14_09490 [Burkholderiales bacterium]|nr:hypothetical protein [Burkholderiales bacterium]